MVDEVLKLAKEGKALGVDDTSVTFYIRSPTAKAVVTKMLQLMWRHEVLPENLPVVLQIMIHKAGRAYDDRKNFRPITLLNDLMKLYDGCLYYYLARETGTIREPPPGETELVYLPKQSQAASG